MSLAVIVLNWNGRYDTLRCLDSLLTNRECPGLSILVVDNGSSDGSAAAVRRAFPEVEVLETGRNLGYAGGNNVGLAHGLKSAATHICVLNNDTVVPPDFIDRILRQGPEPGIAASPVIRRLDGTGVWFEGSQRDPRSGLPVHQAATPAPTACTVDLRPTDFLTGCCIVAHRSVWEQVGNFDERHFLIFEDSDWSRRARRQGIRLVVDTSTVIEHAVSASFHRQANLLGDYYWTRNALLFRSGDSLGVTARTLWSVAVRPAAQALRHGNARLAAVRLLAIGDYYRSSFGEAGRFMSRLCSQ